MHVIRHHDKCPHTGSLTFKVQYNITNQLATVEFLKKQLP